jgi:hypothetical protein
MGIPQVRPLDATTREGFLEIAAAFGRDRAHAARIAQLEALLDRDRDFRWFGSKWERLIWAAKFDRDWERDNPGFVDLMIEGGQRSAIF